ncbi:hypothetical protein [Burkholderia gladioli]|uniref:hypothetical protein n=1 Tax=Burkholderia gladioli TaxID=28095 RepID=UPI001640E848|nr:hypothetical protein [Burkholderia gladioli]
MKLSGGFSGNGNAWCAAAFGLSAALAGAGRADSSDDRAMPEFDLSIDGLTNDSKVIRKDWWDFSCPVKED